ncbi:flagellar assembly protein H [Limnofasciculus baicalensis]|uniref:Flagellar assembly protein H n=1 Tax=Limnofasciculus baicalensis BBK-W-15 TaxID=2699891 RepID=A0AAE3GV59_9CYAN|nr:flagellar assembly protein H [Limnofasciculus baicalensis]MCP2730463.1 flagellar assembly protein H [Limnofasciculus baicalensis BBK-W-15]
MTRFAHDQFAKDILDETLGYIGGVNPAKPVASEVREIDVYFTPNPDKSGYSEYREKLGLLGKMAGTPALFEPFRNPVTPEKVLSCLSKLLDVKADLAREAKRENTVSTEAPWLWILTPTASETLLNGFKATGDEDNWGRGIYFLGEYFRTAIVVIHQLPKTPETLWLRILGRGKVQEDALASLAALPVDNPWRGNALELVYQLQSNLRVNREQKSQLEVQEDDKLIMAIAPLFQEQLAAAEQRGKIEGVQEGIERGVHQGQRLIIESFIQGRFGELFEPMVSLVEPLSALPPIQVTRLLLQLSQLPGDSSGMRQGQHLIVETLLKFRFGELDEILIGIVESLLALPPVELKGLLLRLSELSRDQFLELLG